VAYKNAWTNSTPAAPLTITIAPAAGDILIAYAVSDDASANTLNDTAAGWTQVARLTVSAYDNQVLQVLRKKSDGTETSVVFANGGSSAVVIGGCVSFDGRDQTTYLDVAAVTNTRDGGAGTTLDISMTPVTNGCDIIYVEGNDRNNSGNTTFTFSTTAGTTGAWTNRTDQNSGFLNVAAGHAVQATAGAITARCTTNPTGEQAGVLIALRPAAGTTDGVGSSSGTATVSGIGASTWAAVGASAGAATAAGTSASTWAAVGASAGMAEAAGVGASTWAAVGSAAGTSTCTAVGKTLVESGSGGRRKSPIYVRI
jgi:hypothetical protein